MTGAGQPEDQSGKAVLRVDHGRWAHRYSQEAKDSQVDVNPEISVRFARAADNG